MNTTLVSLLWLRMTSTRARCRGHVPVASPAICAKLSVDRPDAGPVNEGDIGRSPAQMVNAANAQWVSSGEFICHNIADAKPKIGKRAWAHETYLKRLGCIIARGDGAGIYAAVGIRISGTHIRAACALMVMQRHSRREKQMCSAGSQEALAEVAVQCHAQGALARRLIFLGRPVGHNDALHVVLRRCDAKALECDAEGFPLRVHLRRHRRRQDLTAIIASCRTVCMPPIHPSIRYRIYAYAAVITAHARASFSLRR